MKKPFKFILTTALVALLIAVAATAVGCGSADKSDKISVKSSPRLEYLIGQDLDLSKGSILSISGDTEKEVALTASGVTVSGYDKNKLGKQTVTVGYGGQTCTFTVNVHGKIEAVDYLANYIVGETFSTEKGKLLIYRDDGVVASSVRLNSSDVTISASTFTQEGGAAVTARYKGDTVEIPVDVYLPENVKLQAPSKLYYKSHETELDTSGGYFTLTANGGKLVKNVSLTADMIVSGFNPAASTEDNILTPVEQEVTASCLGQNRTFTVKVTYSYVSYMRAVAAELEGVDLSSVPAQKGERAVAAIGGYFGLSYDDKALVSESETTRVVKVAAVYGKAAWNGILSEVSDTVEIDDKGNYSFKDTGTYAEAQADYNALSNKTDTVISTAEVLRNIAQDFAETEITGGKNAADYIGKVMSGASVRTLVDKLKYMLYLYDLYKNVAPSDNGAAVKTTLNAVAASGYKDFGCTDMYDAVAAWHSEPGDMFEIFYDYCYDNSDVNLLAVVCRIKLIGDFATLYDRISSSLNAWADLYDYVEVDTTEFMMRFAEAETFAASLAAKGKSDAETAWLYENMTFPFRNQEVSFEGLIEYLRIVEFGYYPNCNGALGDASFDSLWNNYIAVVNADDEAQPSGDAVTAEELLSEFVLSSPSVQYAFLASVYTTYGALPHYNAVPQHALSADASVTSRFYDIIFSHYTGSDSDLPSACQAIFCDLMTAAENYALRYYGDVSNKTETEYIKQFFAAMQSAQTKYAALGIDKTAFDDALGYFYDKYSAIYAMYNSDGSMKTVDLGAWEAKFEALKKAVRDVTSGYTLIINRIYVYGSFVAGYEYARTLAAEILASGDETVKNAYYYLDYVDGQSLDSAMYTLRESYVNNINRNYLWREYGAASADFKAFMAKSSPVMQMFIDRMNDVDEDDADVYYGAEHAADVKSALNAFYSLKAEEKVLFYQIDYTETDYIVSGSQTYYRFYLYDQALMNFFGANLKADVYSAASDLMDWEFCDASYEYSDYDDGQKGSLDAAVASFKQKYESFDDDERAEFDEYFAEMYAYYNGRYESYGSAQ